ncbi:MAG: hypothetical protein KUG61_00835 [Parvibaculaceae bacterium]|nr:hypothetical protein [Parvibaculaceae bacterium]
MEAPTLFSQIMDQPPAIVYWVFWLMAINTASILFIIHRVEARWTLAAWLLNGMLIMPYLYDQFGFVRLLGLAHIVVWTPLLLYLYRRRETFKLPSLTGIYFWLLMATNAVSLGFDYVDLARYFLGDAQIA